MYVTLQQLSASSPLPVFRDGQLLPNVRNCSMSEALHRWLSTVSKSLGTRKRPISCCSCDCVVTGSGTSVWWQKVIDLCGYTGERNQMLLLLGKGSNWESCGQVVLGHNLGLTVWQSVYQLPKPLPLGLLYSYWSLLGCAHSCWHMKFLF